jgi:hypothetical protein
VTLNGLQKELGMEAHQTGVFVSALASNGLLQVTKTEEGSEDLFANSRVSEIFLDKSKESCMGDITKTFDNHLHKPWNNLIESLQTYKPLNAADGGGTGSIFDQARSKQAFG